MPNDLMHSLECLAGRQGMSTSQVSTPKLYKAFTDIARKTGLVPETSLMISYYLRTNPFHALKMIPQALNLLRHGRLDLKPHRLKPEAQRQFKAILDKAKTLGEMP